MGIDDDDDSDRLKRQALLDEMARYEDGLRYRSESTSTRAALLFAAAAIGSGVSAGELDGLSVWALLLALVAAAIGATLLIPALTPGKNSIPPQEVVELAKSSSYDVFVDTLLAKRVELYDKRFNAAKIRGRSLGVGFALFAGAILVQLLGLWFPSLG